MNSPTFEALRQPSLTCWRNPWWMIGCVTGFSFGRLALCSKTCFLHQPQPLTIFSAEHS